MKKTIFLTPVLFFAAFPCFAMTLQEAMQHVVKTNPAIIQSSKDVEIAGENKKQSLGAYFPTLTATADMQDIETDTEDSNTVKGNPRSAGLTLSQTLFKGGALTADFRAKRNEFNAAQATYRDTMQTTLLSLVTAYVDVLRNKEVFSLNKNLSEVLNKQLEAVKSRFELGEVTKTDIKQAEARLASAEADQLDAEGVLRSSEATLKQILGVAAVDMSWPASLEDLPNDLDTIMQDVLANHPKVMSALALLAAEKHNVQTSRASHMPEITASAAYDATKDSVGFIGSGDITTKTFKIDMALPLYRGGRTVSEVREAVDRRVKTEQAYEAARREVEQELISAFHAYKAAEASLVSRKKSEEANKLASEGVALEEELGERTILDVLDAEQELLESQVDVARAKHNVTVSAYRLKSAMGSFYIEDKDDN